MNHVSIFEKKWIDLVFEGKNKAYGAYQLRQENPRTTIAAMFYGLLFLSGVAGTLALFSAMNKTVQIVSTLEPLETIHPVTLEPIQPKQPEKAAAPLSAPNEEKPTVNAPLVVAPTNQAEPDVPRTDAPSGIAAPAVPGGIPSGMPGGTAAAPSPVFPDDGPVLTSLLDKLPEFPGGINAFYQYVGRNFEKPDINDVKSMRVIVSFVIEKDGRMTDIKVARDPGYGMGKEAIRVLKSLKEKWEPGLIKGQPVRTSYNLPITVNME